MIVVAAGLAGSSAAKAVAEKGAKTILVERHQATGVPRRCCGVIHGAGYTDGIVATLPERPILNRQKLERVNYKVGIRYVQRAHANVRKGVITVSNCQRKRRMLYGVSRQD